MSDTLRRPEDFVEAGLIAPEREAEIAAVADRYAVSITRDVAELIDPADAADPIARQFVPDARELVTAPEERADPIGDHTHEPVKGVVHRYPDRVLLKPIHVCPVYCRFCFRREDVGPGSETLSPAELDAALDYIRSHDSIWEVILSGGDPLMLSARRLKAIVQALEAIPHVAVIRIHTRVPVVDPSRVTAALVAALR
jgi:lysine 2,3-aminomutase